MFLKKNAQKGFGLVEIVVGSGVLALVLFAMVSVVNSVGKLEISTTHVIRANYLLLEGVDVSKIFRDTSWSTNIATLTKGTPYYLVWNAGAWESTTTQSVIDDIFYRTITLSAVSRDANSNIVTSGGTVDAGTVKVTSRVSWLDRTSTTTKSFDIYLTNLYAN